MRIGILCTAALVLTACGQAASEPDASSAVEAGDIEQKACSALLREGDTLDFRQAAHLPDADEPVATVDSAFVEVETFLANIGCAAGEVTVDPAQASACNDIGETGFRVCLIATNEGQFFVHEIYPDLVSVMWNRWD